MPTEQQDSHPQPSDVDQLLKTFQSRAESNISPSKPSTLNMIKSKEYKEFPMKEKLPNINKYIILKEFQLREQSQIIMLSKLKSNTFQRKSNKLLSNMNQLREPGKEFNTYQLRLKLFTIQREKNTSQAQADTFKPATLLAQLLSTQQHYLPQLPPIKPSKLQLPLHQLIKLLVLAVVLVHTRLVDIQLADMLPELVQA